MLKKPKDQTLSIACKKYSYVLMRNAVLFIKRPIGISCLFHLGLVLLWCLGSLSFAPKVNTLSTQLGQNVTVINATLMQQQAVKAKVKKAAKPAPKKRIKKAASTVSFNAKPVKIRRKAKAKPKPKKHHQVNNKLKQLVLKNLSQSMAEEASHNKARALSAKALNSQSVRYMLLLQGLVRENWTNPFDKALKLSVTLKIRANNQGQVMNVAVLSSSGNAVYDRQAILAVRRTSPFPVPQNQALLKTSRTVSLTFNNQESIGV